MAKTTALGIAAVFTATLGVAMKSVESFSDYENSLMRLGQITQKTPKGLSRVLKIISDVDEATGKSFKQIELMNGAIAFLAKDPSIERLSGLFEHLAKTAKVSGGKITIEGLSESAADAMATGDVIAFAKMLGMASLEAQQRFNAIGFKDVGIPARYERVRSTFESNKEKTEAGMAIYKKTIQASADKRLRSTDDLLKQVGIESADDMKFLNNELAAGMNMLTKSIKEHGRLVGVLAHLTDIFSIGTSETINDIKRLFNFLLPSVKRTVGSAGVSSEQQLIEASRTPLMTSMKSVSSGDVFSSAWRDFKSGIGLGGNTIHVTIPVNGDATNETVIKMKKVAKEAVKEAYEEVDKLNKNSATVYGSNNDK